MSDWFFPVSNSAIVLSLNLCVISVVLTILSFVVLQGDFYPTGDYEKNNEEGMGFRVHVRPTYAFNTEIQMLNEIWM